jgi:hypothetical protein
LLLVLVIAANKCDLYEEEKVQEESVRKFAKEIGAIYKRTSAKNCSGIDVFYYNFKFSFNKNI